MAHENILMQPPTRWHCLHRAKRSQQCLDAMLEAKSPRLSISEMTEYVLPTHANALGTVFGGQVLAWMDLCAAISAQRHAGTICITAGIDDLSFEEPIRIGQVVRLRAEITATFTSSIEIRVVVTGEDASTGRTWPCVSGFLTFVAVDGDKKPTKVRPLAIESDDERALFAAAADRRAQRLARRKTREDAKLS
jgi:acyl-CoA hydrolase